MSNIAGQYTMTLTASSVGQIKEGITLEHSVMKQKITGDNIALSDQDSVFQGMNMYCGYTLLEYNAAAARAAFWPYGSTYLTFGPVGRLDTAIAGQLILTAIAGTPAAAAPATITLPLCILAEGFPVTLLFRAQLREIPMRMQVYPQASSSNWTFGSLT